MRVVVVGAGPAGGAAAIELRKLGADVVLLGDGRDALGEQLPPEARPLLDRLGLLPLEGQLPCVAVRSSWSTPELQSQDFLFHPYGHGWLLDRATFGEALRQRAVALGCELRQPVVMSGLAWKNGWHVEVGAEVLHADWIVDASGRRAEVARRLGVRRRRFDRLFAVAGRWQSEVDEADATLTVERVGEGFWYTGRLPGRRRIAALVSSARPKLDEWNARLAETRHIAPLLQGYRRMGTLVACPAESSMLERTSGSGWIAVGDAAMAYDPLSSRGISSALESGMAAATFVGAPLSHLEARHEELTRRFQVYREARERHYATALDGSD